MSYKMWLIFQKKNLFSTWTTKYLKKYWTPPLRTTVVLIKGAYFVDLTCYKCWCNPKNAWQGYHYVYFRFSLRSVLKVHLWNKGGEREGGGWATDQICVANATVLKHDTLQWQIQLKCIKWAGKNITAAQCRWCICTWESRENICLKFVFFWNSDQMLSYKTISKKIFCWNFVLFET